MPRVLDANTGEALGRFLSYGERRGRYYFRVERSSFDTSFWENNPNSGKVVILERENRSPVALYAYLNSYGEGGYLQVVEGVNEFEGTETLPPASYLLDSDTLLTYQERMGLNLTSNSATPTLRRSLLYARAALQDLRAVLEFNDSVFCTKISPFYVAFVNGVWASLVIEANILVGNEYGDARNLLGLQDVVMSGCREEWRSILAERLRPLNLGSLDKNNIREARNEMGHEGFLGRYHLPGFTLDELASFYDTMWALHDVLSFDRGVVRGVLGWDYSEVDVVLDGRVRRSAIYQNVDKHIRGESFPQGRGAQSLGLSDEEARQQSLDWLIQSYGQEALNTVNEYRIKFGEEPLPDPIL